MSCGQRYSAVVAALRIQVLKLRAAGQQLASPPAGHVQGPAPVPPDETVRPLREPPPDLTVKPVALPGLHRDVTGERLKQPDVVGRRVTDLPLEPPDDGAGIQASRCDLWLERRQRLHGRRHPVSWHSRTDLVVHILDLTEEGIAV